jgi:BirA family transcriptional regulator, biotin operon repressor / biotin---[acetyl-CoA-carboxylase] ligase
VIRSRPRLPTSYRLVSYDSSASTNDEAKRLARADAHEGTLVWALEQTAGRGRRGRLWDSPPGNLYASLILRPCCPVDQAAQLGFVAALAVGDTLAAVCEKQLAGLSYKWPNDVLLRGRKIAGILLESELGESEAPEFVVIGVGINLVSSPRDTEFPATSIAEEGLGTVSAGAALEGFARHFRSWAERWRKAGFAPIRTAWRARAMALGEPIRVCLEPATLHGRFIDIDQHGALLLESAGALHRVAAGEVFPVTH